MNSHPSVVALVVVFTLQSSTGAAEPSSLASEPAKEKTVEASDSRRVAAAPAAVDGCKRDTDCKGDRVCFDGRCLSADVAKEMERKLLSAEPKGQPRPETPAVSNSSGDFKVIVWTDEAGFMSSIDGQGGWFPTPHTFKVPPGAHSVVIKGGSAYKSVTAPVSVESSDVKVEVAMDRPVFEAGIALTVLGGLEAVGTLVAAIIESEGESRYHSSDHFFSAFLAAMSAPGLVLTLTGGLMIGLDKQHHPEIKVFAGNKLIATPAP